MAISKTSTAKAADKINAILAELAGAAEDHITVASGIRDHRETFVLKPEPMSYASLAEIATKAADEERQVEPFLQSFNHRPWDVALAFTRVMQEIYGHAPFAVKNQTAQIEIPVSPTATTTIPFGLFDVPELKGTVRYATDFDATYGQIGQLVFEIPKKLHGTARGLALRVAEDLKVNSIYKGKAITSDNMPKFLDPYVTDADSIVWSRPVDAALRGSVLNVIGHTDRARERGQQVHRSVLFYGEPGNGKSESINIVAQRCAENGWTYVLASTTLEDALRTARLFAPAVVAIEDVERLVREADDATRSMLLEELDGTTTKGQEIIMVATTNYIGDLEKAFRRRMFKEIEFGAFDIPGAERFLRLKLNNQSAPDIGETTLGDTGYDRGYTPEQHSGMNYAEVARAMEGWGNSYISKVIDFAAGLALEHEDPELTTADLLDAVEAQRPDWEGYLASQSRPQPNRFDDAFKTLVSDVLVERVGVALDNDTEGVFVSKS